MATRCSKQSIPALILVAPYSALLVSLDSLFSAETRLEATDSEPRLQILMLLHQALRRIDEAAVSRSRLAGFFFSFGSAGDCYPLI